MTLFRRVAACFALALLLAAGAHAAPPPVRKPVVFSDYLGVNAPLLMAPPEVQRRLVRRWRDLGLKWMRLDVHWYHLEPQEGRYAFAPLDAAMRTMRDNGIRPVVYLVGSARFASTAPAGVANIDQYPPRSNEVFAQRMVMLARRYPFVRDWQVWNEPNLHPFWQPQEDPEAYGKLLLTTARGFRAQVPDRRLVMGGMAYFSQMGKRGGLMLEALGNLGAFPLVDVIAYHPYTDLPEGDPSPDGMALFADRVRLINTRLRAAKVRQIWATEFGWSTYRGQKVWQSLIDERTQADYLLRRLALSMEQDFDRVFWFALMDLDERADPRDRFYGLLTRDAAPKPAYVALANFLKVTGDRLDPVASPMASRHARNHVLAWKKPDGRRLVFFWGPVAESLALPRGFAATLHDPATGRRTALPPSTSRIAIEPRFRILELVPAPRK